MKIDFTQYFKKYEDLVLKVDAAFARVKEQFPEAVKCQKGCADCCHALFDLTLIEALYINARFNETFTDTQKQELLEKANKADRKIYKIKKGAYRATQEGKNEEEVIEDVAKARIRCPLLGENDLCDMYGARPIACRVYGIPQAIGGKGRTCGLSGFEAGKNYPTLNMDAVNDQLMALSSELVQDMQTRHIRMGEVIVPLSMALITDYDEAYLGIGDEKEKSDGETDAGEKND
jgi:Fe-S-cluster containining protein